MIFYSRTFPTSKKKKKKKERKKKRKKKGKKSNLSYKGRDYYQSLPQSPRRFEL